MKRISATLFYGVILSLASPAFCLQAADIEADDTKVAPKAISSSSKLDSAKTQILFDSASPYPAQGGPGLKVANIAGQSLVLLGGTGSLVLGEHTGLGAGGYSLATEFTLPISGLPTDISFSYAGLILEVNFLPRRLLYLSGRCLIGPGLMTLTPRDPVALRQRFSYIMFEPELAVMLNFSRDLRVGIGLSFRAPVGSDLDGALKERFGGPQMSLTLNYGKI